VKVVGFFHKHRNTVTAYCRIKMRSHLNADTLYARIREDFDRVNDHRASNAKISLPDTLSSWKMPIFSMSTVQDIFNPTSSRRLSENRRFFSSRGIL
jgi:hypothetical protein